MMPRSQPATRCLLLACGNTLRGDDDVGPCLCAWAQEKFRGDPRVRMIVRQQWTPELAEDIAAAPAALFIDCSARSGPGIVHLTAVQPEAASDAAGTHHLDAAGLLALAQQLYGRSPRKA